MQKNNLLDPDFHKNLFWDPYFFIILIYLFAVFTHYSKLFHLHNRGAVKPGPGCIKSEHFADNTTSVDLQVMWLYEEKPSAPIFVGKSTVGHL